MVLAKSYSDQVNILYLEYFIEADRLKTPRLNSGEIPNEIFKTRRTSAALFIYTFL